MGQFDFWSPCWPTGSLGQAILQYHRTVDLFFQRNLIWIWQYQAGSGRHRETQCYHHGITTKWKVSAIMFIIKDQGTPQYPLLDDQNLVHCLFTLQEILQTPSQAYNNLSLQKKALHALPWNVKGKDVITRHLGRELTLKTVMKKIKGWKKGKMVKKKKIKQEKRGIKRELKDIFYSVRN